MTGPCKASSNDGDGVLANPDQMCEEFLNCVEKTVHVARRSVKSPYSAGDGIQVGSLRKRIPFIVRESLHRKSEGKHLVVVLAMHLLVRVNAICALQVIGR